MFLMYRIQDSIGQDSVFYIVHTTYALFDIATMVISQEYILVNTLGEMSSVPKLCRLLPCSHFWHFLDFVLPKVKSYKLALKILLLYQVGLPLVILYKSYTAHPEIWLNYTLRSKGITCMILVQNIKFDEQIDSVSGIKIEIPKFEI